MNDAVAIRAPIARDSAVRQFLLPIQTYMTLPGVTDIAVNFPGSIFYENDLGWHEEAAPEIDNQWVDRLSNAVASYSKQTINGNNPILSADLPDGERLQIVMPPAVETGRSSLTFRIPDKKVRAHEDYVSGGLYEGMVWANRFAPNKSDAELRKLLSREDQHLLDLLENRQAREFFDAAIRFHKNIGVVGSTGSGKTTYMKMLCEQISSYERLITIEDVRELFKGSKFRNVVHLLYSAGGQGKADITPAALFASANRMKPDRVILAELRRDEAFDCLNLMTSGVNGVITSFHADNTWIAFDRWAGMAREHRSAAAFTDMEMVRQIHKTLDIVVHLASPQTYNDKGEPVGKKRFASGVYFDPVLKYRLIQESSGGLVKL